jgi:hypothetical protein
MLTDLQSILSHLPKNIDFTKIRLFVLIYAPGLEEHPLDAATGRPPGSLGSSFSVLGHDQAQSPGDESQKILYVDYPANTICSCSQIQVISLGISSLQRCLF